MFDLRQLERAQEIVGTAMPPTPAHAWPLLAQRLGAERRRQAREPHADRRLQGARRAGLCRSPQARAAADGRTDFGDPRQSRPEPCLCREPPRPAGDDLRAARQFGREEPRDAGVRRRPGRAWRRFPGRARGSRAPRRGRRARDGAVIPSATWCSGSRPTRSNCSRSAPDLDVLYVPIGQGSGICGCILARDLLGPENRDRRRAIDRWRRPMRCRSRPARW